MFMSHKLDVEKSSEVVLCIDFVQSLFCFLLRKPKKAEIQGNEQAGSFSIVSLSFSTV